MSSLLTAQESEALRASSAEVGRLHPEPVRLVGHERLVRKSQGAIGRRLEAFNQALGERLRLELRRPIVLQPGPGELLGREGVAAVAKGWGAAIALRSATLGHMGYLGLSDGLGLSWVELAYGASNRPKIGPNSTLLFDMELIGIKEAPKNTASASTPAGGATQPVVTSDIIKVPSKAEMDKGAKIEVIKAGDVERLQKEAAKKNPEKK